MTISHIDDLEGTPLQGPDLKNVTKKVLISPCEGWEGWCMRVFSFDTGGYTPRHVHPWPHINYITEGNGILFLDGDEYEVSAGSFAYIPEGKLHQFMNNSDGKFSFICIVPEEGDV